MPPRDVTPIEDPPKTDYSLQFYRRTFFENRAESGEIEFCALADFQFDMIEGLVQKGTTIGR